MTTETKVPQLPEVFNFQDKSVDGGPYIRYVPVKMTDGTWFELILDIPKRVGRFVRAMKDRDWTPPTPENVDGVPILGEVEWLSKLHGAKNAKCISPTGRVIQFEFDTNEAATAFIKSTEMKRQCYYAVASEVDIHEVPIDMATLVPRIGFLKTDKAIVDGEAAD